MNTSLDGFRIDFWAQKCYYMYIFRWKSFVILIDGEDYGRKKRISKVA